MTINTENKHPRSILMSMFLYTFANWIEFYVLLIAFNYNFNYTIDATIWLIICWVTPMIILSPLFSFLTRKLAAKYLIQIAAISCAIISIIIPFFLESWIIYLLIFVRSIFFSLFLPATNILINTVVSTKHLIKICSYKSIISQISKMASPVAASFFLSFFAENNIFYLTCTLFLATYMSIFTIKTTSKYTRNNKNTKLNVVYFSRQKRLIMSFFSMTIFMFFLFLYEPQFPKLFQSIDYTANEFGLAMFAVGMGGILASLFFSRFIKNTQLIFVQLLALVSNGACILLLIFIIGIDTSWSYPMILLILIYCGATNTIIFIVNNSIIQLDTPHDKIGSISTILQCAQNLTILLGPLAGLLITSFLNIEWSFIIGGAVTLILGIFFIYLNSIYKK